MNFNAKRLALDAKNEDRKIKLKLMNFSSYIKLTRLGQPTGILLLFLPCLFGIFLALKKMDHPDFYETLNIIFLFFAGSVIMRSAGCIINDFFDVKFDEKVLRTKNRPLAAKTISRFEALILLGFLLFLGLVVLTQFNLQTILSGLVALLLVFTYPLMKRFTYYPQVFLGITFNFGILMSSLAITKNIDAATITLYFFSIVWTVIYDTFYGYQDIDDDLLVGVKSTAIRFGKNPKKILLTLSFLMLLSFVCLGWQLDFDWKFFLVGSLTFYFFIKKIIECDFKNPQNCFVFFKNNVYFGVLFLTAIILG